MFGRYERIRRIRIQPLAFRVCFVVLSPLWTTCINFEFLRVQPQECPPIPNVWSAWRSRMMTQSSYSKRPNSATLRADEASQRFEPPQAGYQSNGLPMLILQTIQTGRCSPYCDLCDNQVMDDFVQPPTAYRPNAAKKNAGHRRSKAANIKQWHASQRIEYGFSGIPFSHSKLRSACLPTT